MATFFATQGVATMLAFAPGTNKWLRVLVLPGACIAAYLGLSVLLAAPQNHDIEGYVLLIGLAMVIQTALVFMLLVWSIFSDGSTKRAMAVPS